MLRELGVRIGYGAGTGLKSVSAVRDEAIWADGVFGAIALNAARTATSVLP